MLRAFLLALWFGGRSQRCFERRDLLLQVINLLLLLRYLCRNRIHLNGNAC